MSLYKNCRNCRKYKSGYCLNNALDLGYNFADLFRLKGEDGEVQEVIKESIDSSGLLKDYINNAIETAKELGIAKTKIKKLNDTLLKESESLLTEISTEADNALCCHFANEDTEEKMCIKDPDNYYCSEWE